jgi:hypothetical protein
VLGELLELFLISCPCANNLCGLTSPLEGLLLAPGVPVKFFSHGLQLWVVMVLADRNLGGQCNLLGFIVLHPRSETIEQADLVCSAPVRRCVLELLVELSPFLLAKKVDVVVVLLLLHFQFDKKLPVSGLFVLVLLIQVVVVVVVVVVVAVDTVLDLVGIELGGLEDLPVKLPLAFPGIQSTKKSCCCCCLVCCGWLWC